jgi:ferredoxin
MISVDAMRCAYCGSCVSVCPIDALDLQETRLVVSEECIDCNLCLPPSPVVTDGFMLVGDAARQVDPLTGGRM